MEVYKQAITTFLPTPLKSHYTFSLRDFSRVISGMLLIPSSRMKDPDKWIKLWIHETYRVFNDRLIDNNDKYVLVLLFTRCAMEAVNFKWHLNFEWLIVDCCYQCPSQVF